MLTREQKQQIRLLCRQHNRMEAEGMVVRSYHAFHGMDAFVGEEWYSASEQNTIPDLFTEKFTRLSDQRSETCWSDTPIGPFGLVGEVDGLRSPIDLYSRPIVGCDERVNGLRTVRPSRLDLALKVLEGEEEAFGHSEILVKKTQNVKFWVKAKARVYYDMINFLNHVAESDDNGPEEMVKVYTYQRLLRNMGKVDDNDIIDAVITEAENNGLKVITIDDAGAIVEDSTSSIEEIEKYLGGYYSSYTIEKTMEQICFELFQQFLEDGSNAQFASICCPAWAEKKAKVIYDEMTEYREDLWLFSYDEEVMKGFFIRINNIINCMEKYAKDSIRVVRHVVDKTIHLFNKIVEENEEDE